DLCLSAADIGHMKPHPLPFRLALESLDVKAEEAIFIGDSPEHDVAGAHGVGMRAIWVRRESYAAIDSIRPDAAVDSLSEILSVLDSWQPGWRTPQTTELG
ncbi:MAG: HAD family hydrolase, partial [Anaerolineae bacterium]|nr:HAD family hydrolase [Anaerolineae bacterium]